MTSEADSGSRRRPPTIDLTATEIETGAPKPGEPESPAAAKVGARWPVGSLPSLAIGAGAGAIVVAAIVIGLWFGGLIPGAARTPAASPQAASGGDTQIAAQLAKIEAELEARGSGQPPTARLAALDAQQKAFGDTLAALNRRLDEIAVTAQNAMERANSAAEAVKGSTENVVHRADVETLANRLAALERSVTALSETAARRTAGADDHAARAALAAEALRANAERGAPFTAELAAVKSYGADAGALAALEPFAAHGIPTAADLARELSQLVPELRQALSVAEPNGGTFLGRLEHNAKNLVRVTPIDAPANEEPDAVVERIGADASRGDLAAARADIAHLPDAAKSLADPWLQKADARDAALAASRRIAAVALAGLGSTNTQ